jgi:hypothetical protein
MLASSLALADVVTLKNGDKLTGAIVKKDGGDLVIKTALAGTVTVKWDQVTSIQTDGPITVVTGGRTAQSTLSTSGDRVTVNGQQVGLGDITALRDAAEQRAFERLEAPGWGELWTGTAGLNFGGSTGNAETRTFLVNANAVRQTRTDKTNLYFTAIQSSATINNVNTQTAQAVRGGWGYSRNLSPKLYANVFNDWETNKFQLLDLRFVLGGGLGYHAWKGEKGFLDLVGGVDYARDKFAESRNPAGTLLAAARTDSRAELYYGDDFGYKVSSNTTFTQGWRMFHNFSDFGAYRMNFDAAANTQITKWLTWNIGVSDRYLAVPPVGRKANDFIYSTGIGITFAR